MQRSFATLQINVAIKVINKWQEDIKSMAKLRVPLVAKEETIKKV